MALVYPAAAVPRQVVLHQQERVRQRSSSAVMVQARPGPLVASQALSGALTAQRGHRQLEPVPLGHRQDGGLSGRGPSVLYPGRSVRCPTRPQSRSTPCFRSPFFDLGPGVLDPLGDGVLVAFDDAVSWQLIGPAHPAQQLPHPCRSAWITPKFLVITRRIRTRAGHRC